jgi:hypothetical protein
MITLNCKICDSEMSSEHFEIDDVIECPDCWIDDLDSFPLSLEYDEGE